MNLKKSIGAGIMISIGTTVYMSLENKIVGALLFTIGLFMICEFNMNLFTGKIGHIIETKNHPNCLIIWFGNFIGCFVASSVIRIAKPQLHTIAKQIMDSKELLPAFILSIFCGMLMFLAVDDYKNKKSIVGLFLGVSVFILSGFEHSIAMMSYLIFAVEKFSFNYILLLAVVTIGNAFGALLINFLTKEGRW